MAGAPPRAPAAGCLILLAAIALGAGVVRMRRPITEQPLRRPQLSLSDAKNTIEGWLKDLGVDPAEAKSANEVSALLSGLGAGIPELWSPVFFLAMTLLL